MADFVVDCDDGAVLGSANVVSGTVPAGGTAILYNSAALSAANFAASWGSGLNLIGVNPFPTLANSGDRIGVWTSFGQYGARDFGNAIEDVTYQNGAGG